MNSSSVIRESVDVVVIGAGLSGLRAALNIQAAGLSCAVVEATDRVGGKTLTLPSKKSGRGVNDLGAAWINDTTQSEIFKLVQHYELQTEIQMDRGRDVWVHDDGVILSPHGVLPVRLYLFLQGTYEVLISGADMKSAVLLVDRGRTDCLGSSHRKVRGTI